MGVNNLKMTFLIILSAVAMPLTVQADILAAMVTGLHGQALILNSAPPQGGKSSQMTFEGKKYHYVPVRIGQRLVSGDVVMTQSDSKVRLVYQNGDSFTVGPSSALSLPHGDLKADKKANLLNVWYGCLRAVVDPKGPMTGLKIKSPSAIAGVRGTDLYFNYNASTQVTKVDLIRGKAELLGARPVEIKRGQVAEVSANAAPVVKAADQTELGRVQVESTLTEEDNSVASVEPETRKQIAEANQKAAAIIVADMQRYESGEDHKSRQAIDPALSVDKLNSMAVYPIYKAAPAAAAPPKGREDELYDKYFKPLGL